MNQLFEQYENLYSQYEDLLKSEGFNFPRPLRTFNIRFRLALDLIIDYKGNLAYVKTKHVKETYILTLRLMDLWNAYEALMRYVVKELNHSLVKTAPDRIKKKESRKSVVNYFKKTGALDSLKSLALTLKTKAEQKEKFGKDFSIYVERIKKSKVIEKPLKNQISDIIDFVISQEKISGIEVLALIYSERNLYYHAGEPGKMGISYTNRKYLLSQYHECLSEVILKTICYVLKIQIKKIK